jgi:hypothetical protein
MNEVSTNRPPIRHPSASAGEYIAGRPRGRTATVQRGTDDDPPPRSTRMKDAPAGYQRRMSANINGATIVASDSMMNFGVSADSFPQVIFSFGTAPE